MDAAQQMGQPETSVTAVLLRGGGLRLYQHCPEAEEWPLDAVIRESGGEAGYRVTGGLSGARVEARRGQSPLRLQLGPTLGFQGTGWRDAEFPNTSSAPPLRQQALALLARR